MATPSTREALLEQGALLYARHGVGGVPTKLLHEAVGTRNESALQYHFGGHGGLLQAILRLHLEEVEARRRPLAEAISTERATGDLRRLVHALAQPMAEDLHDPVGRAHLRIVAQVSHPSLAFERAFRSAREVDVDAASGTRVVRWLRAALSDLPPALRLERFVDLRGHLISAIAARAQLIDDDPTHGDPAAVGLFLENLLDALVAALTAPPSEAALSAARRRRRRRPAP